MEIDASIKRYTRQYPIGPALDIDIDTDKSSVKLRWTDPKNPILDKIYFSKWDFTKIIRKVGSKPENIFDGELLLETHDYNKYKDEYFIDDTVEEGITYFYAIVPCSDLGKHSWDKVDFMQITPVDYSSVLENNSWAVVKTMLNNRCADKKWKIGDSINLELSGNINKIVPLRISNMEVIGNIHKASFDSKHLLPYDKEEIINSLPLELKFLLKRNDITISLESMNNPIYNDDVSRIKYLDYIATEYNLNTTTHVSKEGKVCDEALNILNTAIEIRL